MQETNSLLGVGKFLLCFLGKGSPCKIPMKTCAICSSLLGYSHVSKSIPRWAVVAWCPSRPSADPPGAWIWCRPQSRLLAEDRWCEWRAGRCRCSQTGRGTADRGAGSSWGRTAGTGTSRGSRPAEHKYSLQPRLHSANSCSFCSLTPSAMWFVLTMNEWMNEKSRPSNSSDGLHYIKI